jgi:tetratricopeptide (TPR) repeat protein
MLRESVNSLRAIHKGDHDTLGDALTNLALALDDAGAEGAEDLFLEALAMGRRLFGEDHPEVGWDWSNLGWMRYGERRCAEATADLTRAVEILTRPERTDRFASVALKNLGLALECVGRSEAAERRFREAIAHGRGRAWARS